MSIAQVYLFHIKEFSGKENRLTSGNNKIIYQGEVYLPYSGLSLLFGEFNDSGENHIILHGVFEKKGIARNDNFMGKSIKIISLQGEQFQHSVTYICTQYNIKDLEFEIRLEPETIKYNKSLLQMFSKTCRANFGDNKCKINKHDYAAACELIAYEGNMLNCNIDYAGNASIENDFFTGGKLITNDKREFPIVAHHYNNISIESIPEHNLSIQDNFTLMPACDKSFKTCYEFFNNVVNFRGEPSIPESNIVKN